MTTSSDEPVDGEPRWFCKSCDEMVPVFYPETNGKRAVCNFCGRVFSL